MHLDDNHLKQILLEGSYATEEDVREAERFGQQRHVPLTDYLFIKGLLTNTLLGQAVAEFYKTRFANLATNPLTRDQVLRIPEDVAKTYRVVLVKDDKKTVEVATDELERAATLKAVVKKLFPGKTIVLNYALTEDLENCFRHYRKPLDSRLTEIIRGQERVAPQLFDEIVTDALAEGASDVHFEPGEQDVGIRFRIDGALREMGRLPKAVYDGILNRIKVQARLRIDEHSAAQDGAIRFERENGFVDLRVSIMPTLDGEKVVLRLLSYYIRSFTLADLGLSAANQELLLAAARQPFGMILVTGPTGSGKTTTLYALIKYLMRPEINITTIEDPVEYKIAGINQVQVNQQTNLTFADGLRSIVRQDPNIVLVGEIRDRDTAEIAVNAALTGHLLFSTFHANDASTAIPRLFDMGAEAFLLASTMNLMLAQRLVRRICDHCRVAVKFTCEDLDKLSPALSDYFTEKNPTLYQGKGVDAAGQECPVCRGTGYKGRTALFECLAVTPEMKELILKHPSTNEIWALARSQGARSMFEDGLEKVRSGVTTLDEVLRVSPPPSKVSPYAVKIQTERKGKGKAEPE